MISFKAFQDFDYDIILMYCAGALLEVLGEPWFNLYQSAGIYSPRLRADTLAVFVRSLVTFITIAYFSMGVKGFGYAQMSYGLIHFLTMISATSNNNFTINNLSCKMIDFLPRIISCDNDNDADGGTGTYSSNSLNTDRSSHVSKTSVNHEQRTEGIVITDEGNKKRNIGILKSKRIARFLDMNTAHVAYTATLSSLLKHLLTEADKIALSLTSSTYDRGIFAVSSNYGSLVARMIFLPIEESSRIAFSKMSSDLYDECQDSDTIINYEHSPKIETDGLPAFHLKNQNQSQKPIIDNGNHHMDFSKEKKIENKNGFENKNKNRAGNVNDGIDVDDREVNRNRRKEKKLLCMENLLVQLMQIVTTLGALFLLFGPLYSRVVVRLLFGRRYQGEESVRTLSAVCINVFVLAINGVLEAFVHVAAPPSAFRQINIGFIVSTLLYVISVGSFTSYLGTSGLVMAGALSMTVRIFSSYLIIKRVLSTPHFCVKNVPQDKNLLLSNPVESPRVLGNLLQSFFFPPFYLIISSICVWGVCYFSSQRFSISPKGTKNVLEHVGIGSVMFFIFLGTVLTSISKENLSSLLQYLKLRKMKKI